MEYSKKLKTIRETLGLSQEALGKRIGLTGAHVSRLENGKSIVSEIILHKYIDNLGIDPDWMNSSQTGEKIRFTEKKIEGFGTLGERIKQLRLEMGLSQKKFAENAGVQQADINRVESGKAMLGPQSLKRIAEAYHVGIDWLQFGDRNKKEYPIDDRVIEYLWKNDKLREMIYQYMNEDDGKKQDMVFSR